MVVTVIKKIIFISTTDCKAERSVELYRLLNSISDFNLKSEISVSLHLLLQQDDGTSIDDWVNIYRIDHRLSLSAARNFLLKDLTGIDCDDDEVLIAFPDDDAWYLEGFLDQVVSLFSTQSKLDFFFCNYSSKPKSTKNLDFERGLKSRFGVQKVISSASSNTIFMRGNLIKKIGFFDENLGVGTPAGGGEDTDYSIRAYYHARGSVFSDNPYVGHRDKLAEFRYKYYRGSYLAIKKNASYGLSCRIALARKIAVGLIWVLIGKKTPRDFFNILICR